jgi:hypothetical protein
VITYTMYWHGDLTGARYTTTLLFALRYSSSPNIDSLDITVGSTTGKSPPFLGSELMKNVALNYLSDRLKDKGERFASLAFRALNANSSVRSALAELLKGLANSP